VKAGQSNILYYFTNAGTSPLNALVLPDQFAGADVTAIAGSGETVYPWASNGQGISHITFWNTGARPPNQLLPEPGVLMLLGIAVAGIGMSSRRRRKH